MPESRPKKTKTQ
ncbi:hypothetical protein LEMLEM_LOCUS27113 [Lemmus lemmus]